MFSRDMMFCGGRRKASRTCSKKVGDGFCVDRGGQYYDRCVAETDLTLEECQQKAENTANVIGMDYTSAVNSRCDLLYDDTTILNCPNGFVGDDEYEGKGPVSDSDGGEDWECYICEN